MLLRTVGEATVAAGGEGKEKPFAATYVLQGRHGRGHGGQHTAKSFDGPRPPRLCRCMAGASGGVEAE